jgi:uncharacterized membrane protein
MRGWNTLFTYLRKLALCFWIGEMLFFVTIFAPRVFRVLEKSEAALLQAAIFPPYYFMGFVCGLVILASLSISRFGVHQDFPGKRFGLLLGLTAFACLIFAFSRWWITPEILQVQPLLYGSDTSGADTSAQTLTEARAQFDFLHKLSVQVNGAALLALLVLLFFI